MNLGQHTVPGSTGDDFCGAQLELVHWQLSPGMMLGSCLVLGVCVSSFLYRHQQDAPQQSLYFIFTILTCITAGGFARAGMDMIVLAYLPWALCLAMFASPCGHYLMRWAGGRGEVSSSWDTEEQQQQQYSYDEKATFLG
ncbi:hypothetical protein M406DRAFT_355172 [Cryphonectria parasitica EP155]|uniref:Uncharacterized protein n=1 Tax=Cryphonectria parasitica (strain ATCC 38755 / EP155) TaxID=660469 RepID=A0A9P4Y969_CRYP1|nr:uncharacterized protein M406DRAFT_355172 [Cryphonectria parasitica EP155]KAF3769108.1 hypothetical protein M406DRAFT_355172 [Cryphonectria parasitica EP155]